MKKWMTIIGCIMLLFVLFGCRKTTTVINKNSKSKNENAVLSEKNNATLTKMIDSVAFSYVQSKLASENDNVTPGAQVVVVKKGKIVVNRCYGDIQAFEQPAGKLLQNPVKVKKDTLFDLASTTKLSATTQALMHLVYEKKIKITDAVSKYIPAFAKNGKASIEIGDLLTHTSGLPQWKATYLYATNKKEVLNYICNVKPEFKKGEYKYSDLGFMTLGFIIEKVTGQDLDKYVESELYKPLGMTHTVYNPLKKKKDKQNIAVTSFGNPYEKRMIDEVKYPNFGYDMSADKAAFDAFNGWRNYELQGEANDGNAAMANNGVAGHAGLFSTASDLAILYQTVINNGTYNGVKLYDKNTLDEFLKARVVNEDGSKQAYGFMENDYWMKTLSSDAVGHAGFTGTFVTVSRKEKTLTIILTNKMNDGQTKTGGYTNVYGFAESVNNAVKQAYAKSE